MKNFVISDFSGGLLETNNPEDFKGNTWSKLKGFIPRNSYTMESQWPIQSVGAVGSAWTGNAEQIKAVYPLQSVMGVFLIALKEDGSLWWSKAPLVNDNYATANAVTWTRLTTCENYGYDEYDNETQPNKISVTSNPDYRFITSLPFEVFKYIKEPYIPATNKTSTWNITYYERTGTNVTIYFDLNGNTTNNIEVGDEIRVVSAVTNIAGSYVVTDVNDLTITYTTSNSGTIAKTAVSSSTLYSNNNRGNNIDNDTLINLGEYSKSTVSGLVISARRRYAENGQFGFISPITANTHQTLVAYVDPNSSTVKVVSFPNIRRWPQFKVEDETIVSYEISAAESYTNSKGKKAWRTPVKFYTQDFHNLRQGGRVKIKNVSTKINNTLTIKTVDSTTSFTCYVYTKLSAQAIKIVEGSGAAEALGNRYNPVTPFIPDSKNSSGTKTDFLDRFPIQTTGATWTITNKAYASGVLTLTLSSAPSDIAIGTSITVAGTSDSNFNGQYVVSAKSGNTISYRKILTLGTLATTSATGTVVRTGTILTDINPYPRDINFGHPYTWLDNNLALHPGTGFIPRGNVGTMWGNNLIIGDIEYRSDIGTTGHNSKKIKAEQNTALLGTTLNDDILRDDNTSANRGAFYYSDSQIDEFSPYNVLQATGTDTRIVGMHQLNNKLIVISTSGGEGDGVIVYSGLLSQLNPYTPGAVTNPVAVRRQVIKSGVGPADFPDYKHYDVTPTCIWPDANMVCFIDKRGGVYGTDGSVVQKLDNFGPRTPRGSAPSDWVAATGKNLLVWNQTNYASELGANATRLLCFTLTNTSGGTGSGAWTELVGPGLKDGSGNYYLYNLKSFYGCGTEFYGVVTYYQNLDGQQGDIVSSRIIRFAIGGPEEEKGCADGQKLILSVATPSIGSTDNFKKIVWNKVGLSFYTGMGANFAGYTVKGASALEEQITITNESGGSEKNFPQYQVLDISTPRVYAKGLHNILFHAGIGATPVISVEWLLMGDVRLESSSVWYSGTTLQMGDDVASEQ